MSIISDIYRDLGIDEISESDIIEWASQALEHMNVHSMYDINTSMMNVVNYRCDIPDGLIEVLQIAKHLDLRSLPKKPTNIFFEQYVPKCGCEEPKETGCGCIEEPEKKLCVCQSFVNNWGWAFIFNPDKYRHRMYEWQLVVPTNNNFFKTGVCNDSMGTPFLEYMIDNGKILFSFKEGVIILSYKAVRLDENGYPMVPDEISARTAITKYIIMKYMTRQWYLGREGYQDKMMKSQQDWDWYCRQFRNKVTMPDEDEYRKIQMKENRLILRPSRDFRGYIDDNDAQTAYERYCAENGINMFSNMSFNELDSMIDSINGGGQ